MNGRSEDTLSISAGRGLLMGLVLALASPLAGAAPLSKVFKRVDPAVVVVRTSERVPGATTAPGAAVAAGGMGSGVLISADGKILTAAHVVHMADDIVVEFAGGALVQARVVSADVPADVALLQLEHTPPGVEPARLGDSDAAEVGDQVFVVGAPLGIAHTLTVGHLSARRRPNATFGGLMSAELFQTDAAINQGNSGGPMFNMNGEVIGIVSHIVSRSGGSEGLGFVVTSNLARRLLLEEPSVWSGLEGFLLADEVARAFNLRTPAMGLLVQRVARGSPAEQLGLKGGTLPANIAGEPLMLGGDIILDVEGVPVGAPGAYDAIRRRLTELRTSGRPVRFTVLRAGETVELRGTVRR